VTFAYAGEGLLERCVALFGGAEAACPRSSGVGSGQADGVLAGSPEDFGVWRTAGASSTPGAGKSSGGVEHKPAGRSGVIGW
jgi:hypothetical protein